MAVEGGGGWRRRRDLATGGRWTAPALLLLVAVAAYGRAAGRGFTSEDFLLVRHLGDHPPWRDFGALFAAPWLGITAVGFWRPVATLLYGLEVAAFGAWAPGYGVTHTLVHALNAAVLWATLRFGWGSAGGDKRDATALVGGALFLLYPLHPNAVLFSASFATLFSATFTLAAVGLYMGFRRAGSWRLYAGALGAFGLALGSYEGAAVLPAILLAADQLRGAAGRDGLRARLRVAAAALPFIGLLGLYLGWRRRLFGVVLGGYSEYSQRLLSFDWGRTAADVVTSVRQLHLPIYDPWPTPLAAAATAALLCGGGLVLCLGARRRLGWAPLRLWLLAWTWILVAQLPFAFHPSVPANGRYWYLAAAGVALEIAALARAATALAVPWGGRVAWVAVSGWAACWTVLLQLHIGSMLEAARLARRVQVEVRRAAAAGDPVFVTRHPYFIVDSRGTPLAQVLRYGLRDALRPPFAGAAVAVYPLPPLSGAELVPVALGKPDWGILEWAAEAEQVRAVSVPPVVPEWTEFRVLVPADGVVVAPATEEIAVEGPPGAHAAFRLLLSGPGNGAVFDLPPEALRKGVLRANLPPPFFQTMDQLYGPSEYYWWVEARDAAGRVSGFSRLRSLRAAPSSAARQR